MYHSNTVPHSVTTCSNCLFRALADQMDGRADKHMTYRAEVCNYMTDHQADFSPFLDEGITFDKYSKSTDIVSQWVMYGSHRIRNNNYCCLVYECSCWWKVEHVIPWLLGSLIMVGFGQSYKSMKLKNFIKAVELLFGKWRIFPFTRWKYTKARIFRVHSFTWRV